MISFQRSNTPYMSIFPFNAKRFAPAPAPAPAQNPSPRISMANKIKMRKPGTRKPRVITRHISSGSTTSNAINGVQGFEYLLQKSAAAPAPAAPAPAAPAPAAASIKGSQGFAHLFQ